MSSPGNPPALGAALRCLQAGDAARAEQLCRELLRAEPDNAKALQLLGVIALQHSKPAQAVQWLERAVQAAPGNATAHGNLGTALVEQGRYAAAIEAFGRALALKPDYAEAHYNLGNALRGLERLEEAAARYRRALELKPAFAEAANNLGGVLQKLGRLEEAGRQYAAAFDRQPRSAQPEFNLALLAEEQADPQEALRRYRALLEREPGNADAHNNLGNLMRRLGRLEEAEAGYRAALAAAPGHALARNNLGNVLRDLGRLDEAREWYAQALQADAGSAEACANMAGVLREQGRPAEALRWLERALAARPAFAEAWLQFGNLQQEQGRREEALACFGRALEAKPDYPEALAGLLHQMLHLCDWSRYEELSARLRRIVAEREDARVPPFAMLALELTPAEQLRCARNWARLGCGPLAPLRERLAFAHADAAASRARLRIGYLSADFRAHPVAYLATGLLELHDRAHFEVFGYGTGPDDGSAARRRMIAACDRYADLRGRSHEDAARAIHADRIDILVDLTGYTQWGRPEIPALRPAPLQVNFLGFPGTLGADFIDYLVADDFLVPPGREGDFAEQVLRLPAGLPHDARRPRPGAARRAEHGLPEGATVFCCFNQSFKILPGVFAAWMRVLRAVPGSVLWLTRSNARMPENLRREAAARGVDPARLVFAPWIQGDLARHYARVALADLFLDTAPFNANATASDALWCGVPVLSCAGDTFIARAAGSLLTALGLPELIARDRGDYEARAVALARSPGALAALRDKLARRREQSALFDAAGYARALEAGYQAMWRRRAAGEAPACLRVAAPDNL